MALLKKAKPIWASTSMVLMKNRFNLRQALQKSTLEYRVRASTLMETLVATVLIVIIFMVASMTMNNLLMRNVKQNTELAEERLNALEYQIKNKAITLPYYEDFESWEISIIEEKRGVGSVVTLEAENTITHSVVTNYITGEE